MFKKITTTTTTTTSTTHPPTTPTNPPTIASLAHSAGRWRRCEPEVDLLEVEEQIEWGQPPLQSVAQDSENDGVEQPCNVGPVCLHHPGKDQGQPLVEVEPQVQPLVELGPAEPAAASHARSTSCCGPGKPMMAAWAAAAKHWHWLQLWHRLQKLWLLGLLQPLLPLGLGLLHPV